MGGAHTRWLPPLICAALTIAILVALSLGLLRAQFVRDLDDVWVEPYTSPHFLALNLSRFFTGTTQPTPYTNLVPTFYPNSARRFVSETPPNSLNEKCVR